MDWKSVVNIHTHEERNNCRIQCVLSFCLRGYLRVILQPFAEIKYKCVLRSQLLDVLQNNLPSLPQTNCALVKVNGLLQWSSCLSSVMVLCCTYLKYNYYSKVIPSRGGIAPVILNRGIRWGKCPAARTDCVVMLNKLLVTSVRKLCSRSLLTIWSLFDIWATLSDRTAHSVWLLDWALATGKS